MGYSKLWRVIPLLGYEFYKKMPKADALTLGVSAMMRDLAIINHALIQDIPGAGDCKMYFTIQTTFEHAASIGSKQNANQTKCIPFGMIFFVLLIEGKLNITT